MLAATLPGFAQGTIGRPTAHIVQLGIVVAILIAISTAGLGWAERRPGVRPLYAMLAAYTAATSFAIWFSDAHAFLVAMPLISVYVLYLSLRMAIGLSALVLAWLTFVMSQTVQGPGDRLGMWVLGAGSSFAFVIVFSLITRRERYARRDLAIVSAELEVLATSRERNRIAREIHDSLGHFLTVANVQLEAARTVPEGRDERLQRVQQLLKDGLGELRRSVSILREGPTLPPFTEAIAELVAECNDTGLVAELTTHGTQRPVPGSIGFTLYRATQEALTNVRKHAQAKKVAVALDYRPGSVALRVVDDGVGVGTHAAGNGLAGLKERVALAGGTVKLEHPPAGGFAVVVEVPA